MTLRSIRAAGPRLPLPSQSEYELNRLVAHLAQFRGVDEPGPRVAAEPGHDGDILPAAGLEGHRRRVDAGADVDLPQLLKGDVVVGPERSVGQAREEEAAGGRQGCALIRVR